jgi:hypothetical protein
VLELRRECFGIEKNENGMLAIAHVSTPSKFVSDLVRENWIYESRESMIDYQVVG